MLFRSFFADESPNYDVSDDLPQHLSVGRQVEHEIFGRGKILLMTGRGDNVKAVVEFASVGRKNLMLKYARLKEI